MRRALKWAAGLLAGLALLAAGGVVALTLALDAGALTPRILAAIEAATGRTATLGAVSLRPGLVPAIVAEGATLANLPGGSRPEMARIRRLEARVALIPLLRGEVEIRGILLDGADILLERLADGTPNWILRAAPRSDAPQAAPETPRAPAPRRQVTVAEILLTDSRITLPDPRLGTIDLPRARIAGIGGGNEVTLTARLGLQGLEATLDAAGTPVAAGPWPLRATLGVGANRVLAEGLVGQSLRLTATLPEPAALAPLLASLAPGLPPATILPPIEATATFDAAFQAADIELRLGAADLSAFAPGLALVRAELSAAALDQAAQAVVEGTRAGLPFRTVLRVDRASALLASGPEQPIAFTAEGAAAGATLRLNGRIDRPRSLSRATMDLRLVVPDLAALGAILPDPPPLRDVTVEARLVAPGRIGAELRVPSFRVASPLLQAEGELVLQPGTPIGVTGRVAAGRIDLDGLAQELERRAPGRAAAPASSAARPAAPAPAGDARAIPDIPLPLAATRAYRGRLELSADHLIVGGTDWRRMRGVLAVADGVARLTDFAAVTPGGPVRGQGMLDAARTPPAVELALRSEGAGLDLAALRRARQEATGMEGRAEIRIEVSGRGATTRAVAATLTGEAGMALVGGRLARGGMLRLGPDLTALLLPGAPQDGLDVRCLALRISAEDGMATTRALLLETSAGRIEGVAAVNLRSEDLAARLLPDVTLLGVRVRAPVGIGGTIAAPRVGVEPGRALTQVIGDTVANRLWRDPTVEWLRGRVQGGTQAGDCEAQLRLARFGADGPVPPAQRVVPGVPRELQGTTQDVLRGLGGAIGGILGGGRR